MAAIVSSDWLESAPGAEPVKKAYLALKDQLRALAESGLCTGSTCKCNSVNNLVQQVCQAAAAAQNSYFEKQLVFPTPPEEQQQEDRSQARLQMQGVMPVVDIWINLPSMAARLLRGQHSPDAACSLADAFNRWGGWIRLTGNRTACRVTMQLRCCWLSLTQCLKHTHGTDKHTHGCNAIMQFVLI